MITLIVINKKSDSPNEDKSVHDARLLIPTLQDFFQAHPLINPGIFLGDAAFDSVKLYKELLSGDTFGTDPSGSHRLFSKAIIPLNTRAQLENVDYSVNEEGIPCCPRNALLPMRHEGISKLKSGIIRYKFSCPQTRWVCDKATNKRHRVCHCQSPCTDSSCGRMIYIYPEKNLRAYPGTLRGTEEWDTTYKIRTTVERSINHFKDSFGLTKRKTRNEKTLHADLILSGITQLIGVILADQIHQHQYLRSLKPLIS